MRRILTTTGDSHPDVPADLTGEGAITGPTVWQVYVDGQPFIGVPTTEPEARAQAWHHAKQVVQTGRYEYVDVRLRPDRRLSQRRAPDCVLSRVFSVVRPEPERRWVPSGSDRRRAS